LAKRRRGPGGPLRTHQYSSGRRIVVAQRSASGNTQRRSGGFP
jgi:hypothetical protein